MATHSVANFIAKLLRTGQVNFPQLLDAKFAFMRVLRGSLRMPCDADYNALALFPDEEEALYLDVGGNRGQSTDAFLMLRKKARIQLFEPNPVLFEKLTKLFSSNPRIVLTNCGLGDVTMEGVLYVPFYKQWMFDGLASFNMEEARDWLRQHGIFFYDDRQLTLRKICCHIRALDELHLNPFFIKLDIQGYEFQALRGAEETLKRCSPVLLLESPTTPIVDYLRTLGYSPYAYRERRFAPNVFGEENTFFMTDDKSLLVQHAIV